MAQPVTDSLVNLENALTAEVSKVSAAIQTQVLPNVSAAAADVAANVKGATRWAEFYMIVQIIAAIAIIVFVIYYIARNVRIDKFAVGVANTVLAPPAVVV